MQWTCPNLESNRHLLIGRRPYRLADAATIHAGLGPRTVTRNTKGNTPFSNYAPFGRSGRFLYGRVSFGF